MINSFLRAVLGTSLALLTGCASTLPVANAPSTSSWPTNLRGHLLLIGGGLDDDNRPVYERFVALARAAAYARPRPSAPAKPRPPSILIATAASGDQDANAKGKIEALRNYCPECQLGVIRRETGALETVALINAADALFFTGGDQKRITDRYLQPDPSATGTTPLPRRIDSPEAAAMRALLARGGVIAGTSAGDAMMSDPMFFTGRSAEALGIRSTRKETASDDDPDETRAQLPLGPQIGQGMGFLPHLISDSHFFERHRFGRLVAALEVSRRRFGIGVGEDAGAEIDLATGHLTGLSVAESLLVDAGGVTRDGLTRKGTRALVLAQGQRVSLRELLAAAPPPPASARAAGPTLREIPQVEPGQNRQLASWRFFREATTPEACLALSLDGYTQIARPDPNRSGWSLVEIEVPATMP